MPSSPFAGPEALPPPRASRLGGQDWLASSGFAHRGLHGRGVPENSRAAILAAVTAGIGIEIDVRASKDGHAFVFHDATLERLSDGRGKLDEQDALALRRCKLRVSGEPIPLLAEALALIAGRVPLLVEIKASDPRVGAICLAVRKALTGYSGKVAVMSFNPNACRWFARHAPARVRGLVVSEAEKKGWRGAIDRWLSLGRARPHFLAYDVRDLPSPIAARARRRGVPVLAWTVRTDAERETSLAHSDAAIFERR